jgi:phosphoglycolate phosphatase-like HAD superfamily hydrolase
MVKVVVLDVDGTLMDTNYLHTEAWAWAFEGAGHRVPRFRLHKQVGKGAGLLIREFVDDEETVRSRTSTASTTGGCKNTATPSLERRS